MIEASVNLHPDPNGEVEWASSNVLLLGAITLTLPIDTAVASEWCQRLGIALLTKAEELGISVRQQQRDLARAEELIVSLRRSQGEIAADGWCWDCKADDHSRHRPFHRDGACFGCQCETREVAR